MFIYYAETAHSNTQQTQQVTIKESKYLLCNDFGAVTKSYLWPINREMSIKWLYSVHWATTTPLLLLLLLLALAAASAAVYCRAISRVSSFRRRWRHLFNKRSRRMVVLASSRAGQAAPRRAGPFIRRFAAAGGRASGLGGTWPADRAPSRPPRSN